MNEQQFDNPFDVSGSDPVIGTAVMQALGMTTADLSQPDKFNKLNDILKYVGNRMGAEQLLSRITHGKNGDKLTMAWEYIGLRSKHDSLKGEMERLSKELEIYER